MLIRSVSLAATTAATLTLIACGGGGADTTATSDDTTSAVPTEKVVVYSGRNEALVAPLFERFESELGIEVEVRYAGTAELAATILEEGANSPADLFFSQDAAALGALSDHDRLRPLPDDIIDAVPAAFAPQDLRDWVGVSGRARSVVYNTELIDPADLPTSLDEVTDPKYEGRFGIAPANGSFQAHMAVYSVVNGAEELDELLAGIAANEPTAYPKNGAIVEAVLAGEVEWGLVNHYYLWRALSERPDAPGANVFMSTGAASGFVNVAGVGVLSDNPAAVDLVRFLLSEASQRYFAEETFEYPLAAGVEASVDLPSLDELQTPEVDFGQVSVELPATLDAIRRSGLLP